MITDRDNRQANGEGGAVVAPRRAEKIPGAHEADARAILQAASGALRAGQPAVSAEMAQWQAATTLSAALPWLRSLLVAMLPDLADDPALRSGCEQLGAAFGAVAKTPPKPPIAATAANVHPNLIADAQGRQTYAISRVMARRLAGAMADGLPCLAAHQVRLSDAVRQLADLAPRSSDGGRALGDALCAIEDAAMQLRSNLVEHAVDSALRMVDPWIEFEAIPGDANRYLDELTLHG